MKEKKLRRRGRAEEEAGGREEGEGGRGGDSGAREGGAHHSSRTRKKYVKKHRNYTWVRFGDNLIVFLSALSGFCPDFGGRRPLLWSVFPAWSRSELVNVGFGPKINCNLFRLRKRRGEQGPRKRYVENIETTTKAHVTQRPPNPEVLFG